MRDPELGRQLTIFDYLERKAIPEPIQDPKEKFLSDLQAYMAKLCSRCFGKGYEDLVACHGMGSNRHMYVTCTVCKGLGIKN